MIGQFIRSLKLVPISKDTYRVLQGRYGLNLELQAVTDFVVGLKGLSSNPEELAILYIAYRIIPFLDRGHADTTAMAIRLAHIAKGVYQEGVVRPGFSDVALRKALVNEIGVDLAIVD